MTPARYPDQISGDYFVRVMREYFSFHQIGDGVKWVTLEHETGNRRTIVPLKNWLAPRVVTDLCRQAYVPPSEFYKAARGDGSLAG